MEFIEELAEKARFLLRRRRLAVFGESYLYHNCTGEILRVGRFTMGDGYSSDSGSSRTVIFILPQKFGSCLYVDDDCRLPARSTQIQRRGIASFLFSFFFLEKLNMVVARFPLMP